MENQSRSQLEIDAGHLMCMLVNLANLHWFYALHATAPDGFLHMTVAMRNFSALPELHHSCKIQRPRWDVGKAKPRSHALLQFLGEGVREYLDLSSIKSHIFENLWIIENRIERGIHLPQSLFNYWGFWESEVPWLPKAISFVTDLISDLGCPEWKSLHFDICTIPNIFPSF